ncbi:hypothetical protein GH714_033959 [Hevea brasiliensis]|uniref:Alcohol dehydrogenase-like C-terminal domain-containing protein n=1 Tax=Hevea brasiliensis TaxID=3981 RepID=A0A6A6L6R5_HEVBR|nr:hypothetical protein GH714_033959 [Hevea brasiliensis]
MPLDASAPILCAGITIYSALKYCELAESYKHVAAVGLGGLGHLAIKFAKAFGAKVTIISSSLSKKEEALKRSQCRFIFAMDTMDSVIDTMSAFHSIMVVIGLLKSHGKLAMVGAPNKPLKS